MGGGVAVEQRGVIEPGLLELKRREEGGRGGEEALVDVRGGGERERGGRGGEIVEEGGEEDEMGGVLGEGVRGGGEKRGGDGLRVELRWWTKDEENKGQKGRGEGRNEGTRTNLARRKYLGRREIGQGF